MRSIVPGLPLAVALVAIASAVMAQMPQPGAEHEALKQLEGTWTGEATLQLPGMEPQKSEVKVINSMDLNGFWLMGQYEGSMMGMPFKGHSVWGYDQETGKYVEVWVDSMRSKMSRLEGEYDAAAKKWTKWLDGTHPMTGKPIKERHTVTMVDADHYTMKMAMPGDDGEYVPYMVMEQARAK